MSLYGPRFPRRQPTLATFAAHPSYWHRFEGNVRETELSRLEALEDGLQAESDELVERQEAER